MRAHEWVGAGPVRQAEAMRRGELTSRALTVATLSALDREDARLNAIVQMLTDEAFDAADDADRRRAAGEDAPLLGVPIAIKNDLDVAGRLTGRGSAAFTTPATHDGELVHLLRAAGMVPVATTTMPELAIYGFTESASRGITRNPHDLDRSPGGSSGGSAAVVAAGAVGIATASDGAGSIRIPAASCGVVGFKPTNGTMPESGGWGGLSVQGCLTPTLADSALYLQTFGSFAESLVDAVTSTPPPLRIGLTTSAAATTRPEALDPDVRDRMDQAAELLRGVGHEVDTVRVHYGSDATRASVRYLRGIRTSTQTVERPDLLERRTRQIARLGRPVGPRTTQRARAAGERFGASVHERAGVDVLLMPVMSGTALHVGQFRRRGGLRTLLGMNAAYPYTLPWNHAGVPAVSMPAGVDTHGLPLAVQLVGRPGDDALLMSVAAQLEGKLR